MAKLDRRRIVEALELREIQEGFAVRRCCERATWLEMRQLMEMAERICQLSRAGRKREMDDLDQRLYQRLLELSGNKMLLDAADNYRFLGRKVLGAERDEKLVREEHLAILAAISDGRADDAERFVRAHIIATREAIERVLRE